jgi:monoamine oxidase
VSVDAAVVGAGYAGLAAARHLSRAGKDVCVLEARDRVGGRIWTVERDGYHVDLGGAWLGPKQDAVHALARELGVGTHRTHDRGDSVLSAGGSISRYRGDIPKLNPIALGALGLGMARLDAMAKKLPIDAPWEAKRARAWDSRSAGDWISRNAPAGVGRELLHAVVRGLMTCDPSEVSLLHFLYLVRSANGLQPLLAIEGGYQEALVDGGAGIMARLVADELGERVTLRAPVRAIEQSRSAVRVVADSVEIEARRVIVATPPALAAQIAFTPELPVDRVQLLERMPGGSITKFVAIYEDAFWRSDGCSGTSVGIRHPIEMTLDAGPVADRPGVMAAFAFGPYGRQVGRMAAADRRRLVLDALTARFGPRAAQPVGFHEQDWAAEEWTHGCFMAHLPPGVLTQYGRALREPCGLVHWAGTETSTVSHGAIDGAIRSGIRAADEILASS